MVSKHNKIVKGFYKNPITVMFFLTILSLAAAQTSFPPLLKESTDPESEAARQAREQIRREVFGDRAAPGTFGLPRPGTTGLPTDKSSGTYRTGNTGLPGDRSSGGRGEFNIPNPLQWLGSTFEQIVNKIINGLIALAVPIVAIMVLWGAFKIMTSAGDPKKYQEGGKVILWAAVGFGILLLAKGVTAIIESLVSGAFF